MDYYLKTLEYYSKWLGTDVSIFNEKGVVLIQSKERDKKQLGYPKPYKIYALEVNELLVISYSESMKNVVEDLKNQINLKTYETINDTFVSLFNKFQKSFVFYFDKMLDSNCNDVVQLKPSDYDDYYRFFIEQYPENDPSEWLNEYFLSLVLKGYCFGIKCNGKLVSVTDAPEIPYMSEDIVEPGINTVSHYRNKGYAKKVVTTCCKEIINQGKVPIWSCDNKNEASKHLALSVGFKQLGTIYTISE